MFPYICLTYATADQAAADRLMQILTQYGFCHRSINEQTEPSVRTNHLAGATVLVAMISREALAVRTVESDLQHAADLRCQIICLSPEENEVDRRFSDGWGHFEGTSVHPERPACVAFPTQETPDAHTAARFIHDFFISRLCKVDGVFLPTRCASDRDGTLIAHAVRAHKGHMESAYALGCAYERGEGVPMLEYESSRWIALAADAGLPDARLHLGEFRLVGWGVEIDAAEAFRLFSLVAAAGDVRGEYRLGLCYLNGVGVIKDPSQAVRYLQAAARWGYAPALYRLGLLYRDGIGTEVDMRAAKTCFYKACMYGENGPLGPSSLYAQRNGARGVCVTMRYLRRRFFDVEKTPSLSQSFRICRIRQRQRPEDAWLEELSLPETVTLTDGVSASAHPVVRVDRDEGAMGVPFSVADAAVALGRILECGSASEGVCPHPTRALVWYRLAMRCGDGEAVFRLAEAYRRGVGTPRDPVRAIRLYRLAAEQGDARSLFALAVCNERGIGTEPDMAEAVRLYQQAAESGYAPAQNNLGGCYEYGVGVARNDLTAVEWYVRAAAADHPDALCRLGLCYERGLGVPRDNAQAIRYYEAAARQGHGYAWYRMGVCDSLGLTAGRRTVADGDESSSPQIPQYAAAVDLWQKAASCGVADAAYALSVAYTYGHGVCIDREKAMAFLRSAAERGHIQATYRLGLSCLKGDGTAKNRDRATAYFTRAVELWQECRALYHVGGEHEAPLPVDAISPVEAAAGSLYMLGLCALHDAGDVEFAVVTADPARIERAERCFRESAALGHIGAMTALGDMATYGLFSAGNRDMAEKAYEEAAQGEKARRIGTFSAELFDADLAAMYSAPALMSLAVRHLEAAQDEEDDRPEEAARLRATAWRELAAAVEQGSADALVEMAKCLYFGYGVTADPPAALRLLERAEHMPNGHTAASLWRGDFLRLEGDSGLGGEGDATVDGCRAAEANEAYLRALRATSVGSEIGPYILGPRREERLATDRVLRAEVFYRLATLRAVYMPEATDPFAYLATAVMMGHKGARDDLSRMFDFESAYKAETAAPEIQRKRLSFSARLRGNRARRRLKKQGPAVEAEALAIRSQDRWMTDYYTALWPVSVPFRRELQNAAPTSERPAHIRKPVTVQMRAASLNYLGDCFFYGQGVKEDPSAAVACYREVVEMQAELPRGGVLPDAVIWAQYSLGWCLLYGKGTKKNAREATGWLTLASRTHPEACYVLGQCYERGEGVDAADGREAIRYYRKALKLGYAAAEDRLNDLERRLKNEA